MIATQPAHAVPSWDQSSLVLAQPIEPDHLAVLAVFFTNLSETARNNFIFGIFSLNIPPNVEV